MCKALRRSIVVRLALMSPIVFLGGVLASCVTMQSRYAPLGQAYPPRPEDCTVAVHKESIPQKDFERISRLDVHIEKTHFAKSDFENALPELKKQACLSGADAIINIEERSSSFRLENRTYHVTATGIKFKN